MRADRTQDEDSLDLLLRGQPAVQSRRGRAGGVGLAAAELLRVAALGAFAEEKEVEPEPVEHDGDPPHDQLQRQPGHRVGDARRDRGAQRHRDAPGPDPDAPPLGRRGGRVAPQLAELRDAAREHDEEVVGDDREREVAPAVARVVDPERKADGHAEEEEQGDHGARPAAATDAQASTLALHLPRPVVRRRRHYRWFVAMLDGEHRLHARRRGDLQRAR